MTKTDGKSNLRQIYENLSITLFRLLLVAYKHFQRNKKGTGFADAQVRHWCSVHRSCSGLCFFFRSVRKDKLQLLQLRPN